MSVRTHLNATLKPLLPAKWIVYDYDRTLTNISKVTAIYVHKYVEPAPEQAALLHSVSLVVADPTQNEKSADKRLDEVLEDVLPLIQQIPSIRFERAEKGTRDGFPCWDVQLQIITT